jgi:hypothetical protein
MTVNRSFYIGAILSVMLFAVLKLFDAVAYLLMLYLSRG